MTDAEIEKLAKGLTEGQRNVMSTVKPTVDDRVLVPTLLGNLNAVIGWPKGITEYYSAYYSRLTPLGLRVRNYLEKNNEAR